MSVSIEALAMAGANYEDFNMNLKDLRSPPPHLQVDAFKEDMRLFSTNFCSSNGKPEKKPIMRKLGLIEAFLKNMIKMILKKFFLSLRK